MKTKVIVRLPVTIDIDEKNKTCTVKYGDVPPIKLDDGSVISFNFTAEVSTTKVLSKKLH